MDEDGKRFAVQVGLSAVVLAVGLGVLLFGSADRSNDLLAASGVGMILGYWMRGARP